MLLCASNGFQLVSLYFAERAVQRVVDAAPVLRDGPVLKGVPRLVQLHRNSPTCHYTYVDNVGVLGINQTLVQKGRENATETLIAVGLVTHELTEAVWKDEALGVVFDGKKLQIQITCKRFSRMRGPSTGS